MMVSPDVTGELMICRFLPCLSLLIGALLILSSASVVADDAQPPEAKEDPAAESPEAKPDADSKPEAPADDAAKTTPGVQFEATFAAASGATLSTTNGQDEQREGNLNGMYAAYAGIPEGQSQSLVLKVTEDNTVNGPDGQPGVLRLQHVEVPLESKFSGFLMYGDEETGKMTFPGWTLGEVTMADLRRTFIEFKFRADNPDDPDRFGMLSQFRFEPEHEDSYGRRADFGVLIATGRWRTFRRPIGSANNLEWFLTTVNEDKPPHFKLVWGQHGPIQAYAPGDSLLIDDIRIVVE